MLVNDMHCTQCTASYMYDSVLNPCVRVGDKTYEGALATHYAAETGEISNGKLGTTETIDPRLAKTFQNEKKSVEF